MTKNLRTKISLIFTIRILLLKKCGKKKVFKFVRHLRVYFWLSFVEQETGTWEKKRLSVCTWQQSILLAVFLKEFSLSEQAQPSKEKRLSHVIGGIIGQRDAVLKMGKKSLTKKPRAARAGGAAQCPADRLGPGRRPPRRPAGPRPKKRGQKKNLIWARQRPRARGPGGQWPPTKLKIGRPKTGPRGLLFWGPLFLWHFLGPPPLSRPGRIRPRARGKNFKGFFFSFFFSAGHHASCAAGGPKRKNIRGFFYIIIAMVAAHTQPHVPQKTSKNIPCCAVQNESLFFLQLPAYCSTLCST